MFKERELIKKVSHGSQRFPIGAISALLEFDGVWSIMDDCPDEHVGHQRILVAGNTSRGRTCACMWKPLDDSDLALITQKHKIKEPTK